MRLLLPLLLLSACFPKERVVAAPPPSQSKPQSEVDGVKVWANTVLWVGTPSDTESWILPIGVDIENTSDKGVYFNLDDVRLADDQGNKTAPFFMPIVINYPMDWRAVRERMKANPPPTGQLGDNTAVFITHGGRNAASGVAAWTDETGMGTMPPTAWKEEVRFVGGPKILSTRILTDRMIEPKSRVTGFLYFPRTRAGAKKLTLTWKGHAIGFDNIEVKN